jgi:hypothetical protein
MRPVPKQKHRISASVVENIVIYQKHSPLFFALSSKDLHPKLSAFYISAEQLLAIHFTHPVMMPRPKRVSDDVIICLLEFQINNFFYEVNM